MELINLALVITVIAVLVYKRINLGIAMTTGAVLLGLFSSFPVQKWVEVLWKTFTTADNIQIVAALYLIIALENVLRTKGVMDKLLKSSQSLIKDSRAVLALLPAFIGLLPSLGGAIFSAPLVDHAAKGHDMSAERKFLINYWFRHIWEYSLPVYSSVLLTGAILGISVNKIIVTCFGFTILSAIVGLVFCFKDMKISNRSDGEKDEKAVFYHARELLFALSPIIAILILVIGAKMAPGTSIVLVLAVLMLYFRYKPATALKVMLNAFQIRLITQVVGVLVFKEVLIQSGVVPQVISAVQSMGFTPVVIIALMGGFFGFLTGAPAVAIGIVFPFITGFPAEYHLPLAMVGLVCTGAGQMISPLHLCLVVTQDYFKSEYARVLPTLILMQIPIVVAAYMAYYFWWL